MHVKWTIRTLRFSAQCSVCVCNEVVSWLPTVSKWFPSGVKEVSMLFLIVLKFGNPASFKWWYMLALQCTER